MDPILKENAIASALNSISACEVANEVDAGANEIDAEAGAAANEVVANEVDAANEVEVATYVRDALDEIVDAVVLDDEAPVATEAPLAVADDSVYPITLTSIPLLDAHTVLEPILEETDNVPPHIEPAIIKIPEPPVAQVSAVAQVAPVTVAQLAAVAPVTVAQVTHVEQTPSESVLAVAEAVAVFAEACAAAAKVASNIKKYRAAQYDEHDNTYAKKLFSIFKRDVDEETQKRFNKFTDRLMSEPRINRFSLLGAISDYEKTDDGRKYPFPVSFTDEAFNYRPYQPCIIC